MSERSLYAVCNYRRYKFAECGTEKWIAPAMARFVAFVSWLDRDSMIHYGDSPTKHTLLQVPKGVAYRYINSQAQSATANSAYILANIRIS